MFARPAVVSCVLSLVLSGGARASAGTHYVVTDIGVLSGDTGSGAYGVNDSGQVAGQSVSSSASHATFYSGGTLTNLGALVGNTTAATALGVNDSGAVVFTTGGAQKRSFIYSGGRTIDISQQGGVANGVNNAARAINNNGQVTGWYPSTSGQTAAFLYSGGTNGTTSNLETTIPQNPFYNTSGYAINNFGTVVGNGYLYAGDPSGPYGYPFAWTAGTGMQQVTIGVSTNGFGTADAINDSGIVVGSTSQYWHTPLAAFVAAPVAGGYASIPLPSLGNGTSDGAYGISDNGQVVGESAGKAFLATESGSTWTTTDLNSLVSPISGWTLQVAEAISNNGDFIAGNGTINGKTHGFLLQAATPGDANLDGKVDVNDLTIVLSHFGQNGANWSTGDFVGDGKVDVNDLTVVLSHFGQTLGAAAATVAAVPEPGAFLLLLLALLGSVSLALRANRRRSDQSADGWSGCR
jgi:probable HAF family extracellular repeat protein